MGDAFIARQFDDDDGFVRHDFCLKDLDTSSEWMRSAAEYNAKMRSSASAVNKVKDAAKAAQQKATNKKAASAKKLKKDGNGAFQSGEWAAACQHYTAALDAMGLPAGHEASEVDAADIPWALRTLAPALYSNRSAAEMKLGKYDAALADAIMCTRFKPDWSKAWGRKFDALVALERLDEAGEAIEEALKLAPDAKDLVARRDTLSARLQS